MNITNDWREDVSSVKDKLKYTLSNKKTQQDVVIVVGCGPPETKMKAHSFMLYIGSQVLEELLEQAKMNNEGMKEINLPDVHPEAMKCVLQYIYTDSCYMQFKNAMDILYASLKLNLRGLAAFCVAKLKDGLCSANVLRVFEESVKMNVKELIQYSNHFILKNARQVFLSEQFLNLTHESLCQLVSCDELELEEIFIFNSIIRWGKAECVRSELEESSQNLRFVLKHVVPFIRFTLMPIYEFGGTVVPTNLLDHQEVIDVYNYLSMKSSNASKQVNLPWWISSFSERATNQAENGGTLQTQMQPRNTNKEKLLQYMKCVSGKKTISGLFSTNHSVNKDVQTIKRITGVSPGILTTLMPNCWDRVDRWQSFTKEIITNWKNGYLVQLCWGSSGHPFKYLEMFKTLDDNEWNYLVKEGGHLNREWKKQLDIIVPYLKELQNAGVVVIWDLFPCINNKTFSWGGRTGLGGSLRLYQMTHDYMTRKHQLHSLLWTWSLSIINETTKLEEFWPGNDYVDVASIYMYYKKQVEMNLYQKLLQVVGDKPISMEYFFIVPSPEILTLQPRWTWFTAYHRYLEDASYNTNVSVKTTFQGHSIIKKENNEFFIALNSN